MSPSTRLQIMGWDSREADLRATTRRIMHTCFQSALQEWARNTSPVDCEDWKIHVDRNVFIPYQLDSVGVAGGALVSDHTGTIAGCGGHRTKTESGMGWLVVHTLARAKGTR